MVGQEERVCPRCRGPYSYIEVKRYYNERSGTEQEYRFAVHYHRQNGRRRRCALGPLSYIRGTETQVDVGLVVRGALMEGREVEYLTAVLIGVEDLVARGLSVDKVRQVVKILRDSLYTLERLLERVGREGREVQAGAE